ncbi:MAG: ribonuclease P protein component [Candidatus Omnitrophota bacterium]|jgi:ribonuclease P protein component
MSEQWILIKEFTAKTGRPFVISISKKTVPLSTKRSRIKRLIREAIRLEGIKPPEAKEWNIIVKKQFSEDVKTVDIQNILKNELKKL